MTEDEARPDRAKVGATRKPELSGADKATVPAQPCSCVSDDMPPKLRARHDWWRDFRPELPLVRRELPGYDPSEHHDDEPCLTCRLIAAGGRAS